MIKIEFMMVCTTLAITIILWNVYTWYNMADKRTRKAVARHEYLAYTYVLHFNTLRRRPLRRYTYIQPAAHEFENRITQTPCCRLYIFVLLLFIHNTIYNCSSGITPSQFNICVQCNVYLYTYNAVGRYLMYSIYKTR